MRRSTYTVTRPSAIGESASDEPEPGVTLAQFHVDRDEREAHIVPAKWLNDMWASGAPILLADGKRYRIVRIEQLDSAARVELAVVRNN